jgi:hypothetical protein
MQVFSAPHENKSGEMLPIANDFIVFEFISKTRVRDY